MTPLQQAQIRAGELRKRLSVIGGMAELSDEVRSEFDTLRKEYDDLETRQAALIIAGDAPSTPIETRSSEGREFRQLITRANVGEIFNAALGNRAVSGATAELQGHTGLDGNQIPLALLVRSWPTDGELETRAVTPGPTNVGAMQNSVIPYVFPDSVASFLGVDMPTVGVGESVWPVLTKELDVRFPAENIAADETTGSFSAEVLSPSRIQAAFFYSRESAAKFMGMDAALRENLSMGLTDGLDDAILTGTNGLFTGTNLADNDVSAVTTYALYRNQFGFGRVDGRYASTTADLRIVMGSATYAHAAAQYRGNNDNMDALMSLMEATGGNVRVSAHVPAVSGDKQNAIVRLGMHSDFVSPIWEGITLIPDEVTKAASGQIVVTAIMLFAAKLLRADGFHKQQTQHA